MASVHTPRRFWAPKTETFENAADPVLVSKLWGWVLVWTDRNGDLWKRWRRHPRSHLDWVLSVMTCPSLIRHAPSREPFPEENKRHQPRPPVVNFNMNNELQSLLILLSMPAAVVHLNSAFYNATTAYMRRSKAIERFASIPVSNAASSLHRHVHAQCAWMVMWCVFLGVVLWTEINSETLVWMDIIKCR